jgi:hypothetical protein
MKKQSFGFTGYIQLSAITTVGAAFPARLA